MLANWAEVQANLLYAMGIGWTNTGPGTTQFAIAAVLEVEWDETNRPLQLVFEILDVDGQPFLVTTPAGDQQPFQVSAQIAVGRPPDAAPGTKFNLPVAVNVQPLQFQPGRQYVVRASINGDRMDETMFKVRPQSTLPPQR